MLNSLCLLLAACAAGGPGDWSDGASCGCSQGGRPGVPGTAGYFGPRPRLFHGRLRGLFPHWPYTAYQGVDYGPPPSGPPPVPWAQPTPPPVMQVPGQVGQAEEQEPPLATDVPPAQTAGLQRGQAAEAVPVTTVTAQRPNLATVPAKGLQIAPKYEDKVGHEDDYSWVTGHLFYVHTDGGRWVVRYGLPDQVDKYGGSVVLAPGADMRNYREGDLVCVYGQVINEGRVAPNLGGALYRVNSISLVDRSDP